MTDETLTHEETTMSATMERELTNGAGDESEEHVRRQSIAPYPTRRRRRWWIVAALVAVAAVAAVIVLTDGSAGDEDAAETPRNFADVVRTDLAEIESYDGTLGTVEGDPIGSQTAGTITSAAEVGTTVTPGDVLYSVDGEPVVLLAGSSPAYRDLGRTEDTAALTARSNGTITDVVESGTTVEQGDVLYRVDGEPVVVLYGDTPAYRAMRDLSDNLEGADVLQLETALAALGYNDEAMTVDDEFTGVTESVVENWQEAIGAEVDGSVDLGEVIFVPGPVTVLDTQVEVGEFVTDGRVVVLTTGTTPTSGEDVMQLEQNLDALGFDADGSLTVDGTFDESTTAAIEEWQRALGMEVDGIVNLGEVVFLPDPIQVSDQLAPPGTAVNPGVGVLAVASAGKVVTMDLPAEDQELVAVGDAVTVEFPDGTDVPASVVEVATVATVSQNGTPVFEITIELDDPSTAAGLDEAPVDVDIVSDSAEGVKAIPVTALVALAEGGYAVEVEQADGTVRLVGVEPGFFADGLVEITASEIEVGSRVVVP
jgi:peptidoglycan hydrolase-like protein with peptidoglycan-binding domain